MKKWFFFTGAAVLALAAFINYALVTACSAPFVPAGNPALVSCSPLLKTTFFLFTFASAALFLAFIISHDEELEAHHRKKTKHHE
ncbi:MAG: hypothetical protein Q8P13_02765 [bacterium]|nr:hypothetical protein [bacterium]